MDSNQRKFGFFSSDGYPTSKFIFMGMLTFFCDATEKKNAAIMKRNMLAIWVFVG